MADSAQPSKSDVDLDKSELKAVSSKQRLAKQAEVEDVEESESSKTATQQMADNGEDQSPNSDESDRTVVYTGQCQHLLFMLDLSFFSICSDIDAATLWQNQKQCVELRDHLQTCWLDNI